MPYNLKFEVTMNNKAYVNGTPQLQIHATVL
jgi:hypothetical protein